MLVPVRKMPTCMAAPGWHSGRMGREAPLRREEPEILRWIHAGSAMIRGDDGVNMRT